MNYNVGKVLAITSDFNPLSANLENGLTHSNNLSAVTRQVA